MKRRIAHPEDYRPAAEVIAMLRREVNEIEAEYSGRTGAMLVGWLAIDEATEEEVNAALAKAGKGAK